MNFATLIFSLIFVLSYPLTSVIAIGANEEEQEEANFEERTKELQKRVNNLLNYLRGLNQKSLVCSGELIKEKTVPQIIEELQTQQKKLERAVSEEDLVETRKYLEVFTPGESKPIIARKLIFNFECSNLEELEKAYEAFKKDYDFLKKIFPNLVTAEDKVSGLPISQLIMGFDEHIGDIKEKQNFDAQKISTLFSFCLLVSKLYKLVFHNDINSGQDAPKTALEDIKIKADECRAALLKAKFMDIDTMIAFLNKQQVTEFEDLSAKFLKVKTCFQGNANYVDRCTEIEEFERQFFTHFKLDFCINSIEDDPNLGDIQHFADYLKEKYRYGEIPFHFKVNPMKASDPLIRQARLALAWIKELLDQRFLANKFYDSEERNCKLNDLVEMLDCIQRKLPYKEKKASYKDLFEKIGEHLEELHSHISGGTEIKGCPLCSSSKKASQKKGEDLALREKFHFVIAHLSNQECFSKKSSHLKNFEYIASFKPTQEQITAQLAEFGEKKQLDSMSFLTRKIIDNNHGFIVPGETIDFNGKETKQWNDNKATSALLKEAKSAQDQSKEKKFKTLTEFKEAASEDVRAMIFEVRNYYLEFNDRNDNYKMMREVCEHLNQALEKDDINEIFNAINALFDLCNAEAQTIFGKKVSRDSSWFEKQKKLFSCFRDNEEIEESIVEGLKIVPQVIDVFRNYRKGNTYWLTASNLDRFTMFFVGTDAEELVWRPSCEAIHYPVKAGSSTPLDISIEVL